jgi:hypothetical protein
MKKNKFEIERDNIADVLDKLVLASDRVLRKYGSDDNGVVSDWTEWQELKVAINQAKSKFPNKSQK